MWVSIALSGDINIAPDYGQGDECGEKGPTIARY